MSTEVCKQCYTYQSYPFFVKNHVLAVGIAKNDSPWLSLTKKYPMTVYVDLDKKK
jgi:hypothetical protein